MFINSKRASGVVIRSRLSLPRADATRRLGEGQDTSWGIYRFGNRRRQV